MCFKLNYSSRLIVFPLIFLLLQSCSNERLNTADLDLKPDSLSSSLSANEKLSILDLILKSDSLGPLELSQEVNISEDYLKEIFPDFDVSYEIGSGDSPDFHYFEVSTRGGDLLFSISSYLEYENYEQGTIKNPDDIRIDILTVYSNQIEDQYGIRVGDGYQKVVEKRGTDLQFGAAHHNIWVGSGMIYYAIPLPPTGIGEPDRSPTLVTQAEVYEGNWAVSSISWPTSKW